MTDDFWPPPPPSNDLAPDGRRYGYRSEMAIRGLEGRCRKKWQAKGWEFVSQSQRGLKTELTFRKPRGSGAAARLLERLTILRNRPSPRTRLIAAGGLGALVLIAGTIALVVPDGESNGDRNAATALATDAPISSPIPADTPTPTIAASASVPTPSDVLAPYSYEGPEYRIVITDDRQGPAKLQQFWIVTGPPDGLSRKAYRGQVKLIVADIARDQGTADFIANVVTDERIARAESPSTYREFLDRQDPDFATSELLDLEQEGFVATYTGGFDFNTGKASHSASAYEIAWSPAGYSDLETWQPEMPPM